MGVLSITLMLLVPTGLSLPFASLRYAAWSSLSRAALLALASRCSEGAGIPISRFRAANTPPCSHWRFPVRLALLMLVNMVQSEAQTELLKDAPMIVRENASGEIFAAVKLDDGRVFKLDDQGRFAEDKPRYNAHLVAAEDDVHDVLYHPILYTG